ncbi:MAG: TonB-dependent receptor [Pseudomonadota bacterium]
MTNRNTSLSIRRVLAGMTSSAAIMAAAPCVLAQDAAAISAEQVVDIPAGSLGDALFAVTDAYGVNILADQTLTRGKNAPSVSGTLSAEAALERILSRTDLTYRVASNGAVILAQQTAQTDAPISIGDRADDLTDRVDDVVVVTGSRLERTAVNSPAPIDIVTADDIAAFGLTDTTEALVFTPSLQQSTSLTSPADFFNNGPENVGVATLNLRGLGSNRTLVLLNGRRHVGGVANQATVDVSSIPTALIDRVEVLTGGGSSIYGADAVSGVVNYILKEDFEGVDYRGNLSLPTRGDGEAYFGALTVGGNFADGRGNAVVSVEYNRQMPLRNEDRAGSRTSTNVQLNSPSFAEGTGISPEFGRVLVPDYRFLFFTPFPSVTFTGDALSVGRLFLDGTDEIGGVPVSQVIDFNTGEIRPQDFGIPVNPFFGSGGDGSLFTFDEPTALTVPDLERYSINTTARYEFTDTITGFIEAKYNRLDSSSGSNFNLRLVNAPLSLENPFVPQLFQDQFASLDAQGENPEFVVSRNFRAPFGSLIETKRETFRVVGGFEGKVSDALSYTVSANYGRTDTDIINRSAPLPDRVFAALDVVEDASGNPICRSDIDQSTLPPTGRDPFILAPGFRSFNAGDGRCSPLNPFAPDDALSQAAFDFIFAETRDTIELEQFVLNATITGESGAFLNLPGGPISYAAGIEYRDERSAFAFDALEAAGLGVRQGGGLARLQPVGGGFDVFEGFAEVSVPLLVDSPFAESLAIDASVRVADYSTSGTATSFAFGTVWQPISDLRLRASFNRAVRAANVEELFTPVQVLDSNLNLVVDPCSIGAINDGSDTRAQNCAALIADIANFDPPSFQPVTELAGGNTDLDPEKADTLTIGFAYTPSVAPGLAIVADYYDIEITDAIGGLRREALIENCVDASSLDNPFCDAVGRDPATGIISSVDRRFRNLAADRARGIDYSLSYDFELDRILSAAAGNVTATLAGTYLIRRERQAAIGFEETINRVDGELGFPRHFFNFGLAWSKGDWSVDYGFNYQSNTTFGGLGQTFGREEIEADPFALDQPNTGDAFVHYLGGVYQINDGMQLSLRVNNLFDRDPFVIRNFDNIGTRPTSFLGRTVQLGIQGNF